MSVALVGAGPGDPELITVRGLARVRAAEVLVYDRLVAPELVAEAPVGCRHIARDDLSQTQVNATLVELGRTHFVVRLKGGDPFVFGRGGEEALALADAGQFDAAQLPARSLSALGSSYASTIAIVCPAPPAVSL